MTPKQVDRIKNKIKKIKAALAADKKQWGGQYHDGQGLRYMPPQLYLKLNDFSGGLRYFNWFKKNFPDDSGYPDFLFEWTLVLFKTRRLQEAENKAFETFFSNTYLFDTYFSKPIMEIEKWDGSNLAKQDFAKTQFFYSAKQSDFDDFSEWLEKLISTEKFIRVSKAFLDIQKRLKDEHDVEIRRQLIQEKKHLFDEWS